MLTSSPTVHDADASTEAFLFRLYAVTWGLAALFHTEYAILFWREPALAPKVSAALVTIAAVATCWHPTVGTLVALGVAQLIDVGILLPAVPNHWLLAGIVNVGWIVASVQARRPAELLRRARAPLLVAVAAFYAWTGLWKLNADFVRPEVSCAMVSWERVLGYFHWLPDTPALRYALILGTLAMELVGPLFLLLPATRGPAALAFVAFHIGLGLDTVKVYLNFSSVMFALMILFLPDAAAERLREHLPAGAARLPRLAATGYLVLAAAGVAAGRGSPLYMVGRWFAWLCYAVALFVLLLVAIVGARRPARRLPAGAARSLAWLAPLLVVANGVAPILGLKTRTSWQMYSNVRLEPAASNHYLFPRSLDLLGVMRDTVTVIDGGGIALRDVAGSGLELPWLEFRRRLAAAPDAAVTWERHGERHATARVADDPTLSQPLPLVERKLMIFRPLGPGAAARCDW